MTEKKIGFNPTKFALVIPCRDANSRGAEGGHFPAGKLHGSLESVPPGWKVSPGKAEEAEQRTLEKSNSIKGNLTGPLKRQRKNKGDSKHKDTPLLEKRTEGRYPPAGLHFYSILVSFPPLFWSITCDTQKEEQNGEKKSAVKCHPDCTVIVPPSFFSCFLVFFLR